MTDTAAAPTPPADQAKDTIAMSAATMGRDLTAALLDELRNLPDHWSRLNQDLQQKVLERFKERVAGAVHKAQHMLTASAFQAVPAKLEYVARKGGIRAGITVAPDALCRHALFDAAGGKVLVVIVDPQRWLERMDELKVTGNQADLFDRTDTEYDPAKDQPGYRRDADPFAPAGPTWADMKANLGIGAEKPADPDAPPPAVEPPPVPTGDDAAVDPHRVSLEMLREHLERHGIVVSFGALKERDDADILAATLWIEAVEKIGLGAALASRPAWLPEPPPKKGKGAVK